MTLAREQEGAATASESDENIPFQSMHVEQSGVLETGKRAHATLMQRSRFVPAAFPSCGTDFQLFSICQPRAASAVGLGDTIKRPDATVEATSAGKGQRVLVLLWSAFSPLIYYLTWQAEWMSGRGLCRGDSEWAALPFLIS